MENESDLKPIISLGDSRTTGYISYGINNARKSASKIKIIKIMKRLADARRAIGW